MADDVIERPERSSTSRMLMCAELDVAQPEGLDRLSPLGDLLAGQIDADEGALRAGVGHRDQVAAAGAAQFEDAAAVGPGRAQAEQGRHRRQVVGVGLGERQAGVRDLVVAGAGMGRHRHHGSPSMDYQPSRPAPMGPSPSDGQLSWESDPGPARPASQGLTSAIRSGGWVRSVDFRCWDDRRVAAGFGRSIFDAGMIAGLPLGSVGQFSMLG